MFHPPEGAPESVATKSNPILRYRETQVSMHKSHKAESCIVVEFGSTFGKNSNPSLDFSLVNIYNS